MENTMRVLSLILLLPFVVGAEPRPAATTHLLHPMSAPTLEVEVVNFPNPQNVEGAVAVTNFPPLQQVGGTVSISNLPTNLNGHLLVAVQGSNALVLHSTKAVYQGDLGGRTGATQKCQAEFPGSHFVHRGEIESAFANGRGIVWLCSETLGSWVDNLGNNCVGWQSASQGGADIVYLRGSDPNNGSPFNGGLCSGFSTILCAD